MPRRPIQVQDNIVSFIPFLVLSRVLCYRNDIVLHRYKLTSCVLYNAPWGGWALLLASFTILADGES